MGYDCRMLIHGFVERDLIFNVSIKKTVNLGKFGQIWANLGNIY
jgi:hypothetical protein